MHPRYCHGHQLNSVDRQDDLLELLLVRHLAHLLQQSRHQHLLDEVHQNHLDDLRLGDLGHLDEHRLDEVLQLRHRLDVVLRYLKKMDCYLLEVLAAQK